MSTQTDIPVTIEPEAAAIIAEWGMEREFQQMLEHTLKTLPGLIRVEVTLPPRYEITYDQVLIEPHVYDSGLFPDPNAIAWRDWKIRTFPPEVAMNFLLMPFRVAPNGQ